MKADKRCKRKLRLLDYFVSLSRLTIAASRLLRDWLYWLRYFPTLGL